jgi:hypothetical protein
MPRDPVFPIADIIARADQQDYLGDSKDEVRELLESKLYTYRGGISQVQIELLADKLKRIAKSFRNQHDEATANVHEGAAAILNQAIGAIIDEDITALRESNFTYSGLGGPQERNIRAPTAWEVEETSAPDEEPPSQVKRITPIMPGTSALPSAGAVKANQLSKQSTNVSKPFLIRLERFVSAHVKPEPGIWQEVVIHGVAPLPDGCRLNAGYFKANKTMHPQLFYDAAFNEIYLKPTLEAIKREHQDDLTRQQQEQQRRADIDGYRSLAEFLEPKLVASIQKEALQKLKPNLGKKQVVTVSLLGTEIKLHIRLTPTGADIFVHRDSEHALQVAAHSLKHAQYKKPKPLPLAKQIAALKPADSFSLAWRQLGELAEKQGNDCSALTSQIADGEKAALNLDSATLNQRLQSLSDNVELDDATRSDVLDILATMHEAHSGYHSARESRGVKRG